MRKFLKITGIILASILVLLIAAVLWLQTPSGKNFVRLRAIAFLKGKLKTEVYIQKVDYRIPQWLELQGVLFKDQAKDTMLAARMLRVDLKMWALLRGKVIIQQAELEGAYVHIYRHLPDTNFNYNYAIIAFAGKPNPNKEEVKKANDTSKVSFNVNRANLYDVHLRYDDETGGLQMRYDVKRLKMTVNKLDLLRMDLALNRLEINGSRSSIIQTESHLPPSTDTSTVPKYHIAAREVIVDSSIFAYKDEVGKLSLDVNLGSALVHPREIDVYKELVDVKDMRVENTAVKLWMGKAPPSKSSKNDTSTNRWRVLVGSGKLIHVAYKMDDDNSPRQKSGIDYLHMDAKNASLDVEKFMYSPDTTFGHIAHFTVKERSGLDVKELKTDFLYHNKGAVLKKLLLVTDQTVLRDYLEVGYPSVAAVVRNPSILRIKVNLVKSVIGMKDLLIFAPMIANQDLIKRNRNGHLKLDANINGQLGNLVINRLSASGFGRTEIVAKGRLMGLPNANKLKYDLNIKRFQSSRNDLIAFIPKSVQQQVRIPDAFGASGHISGSTKDYKMQLMIMSTDGNAYVNGYVLTSPGKNRERYDLYVRTDRLNIGRIIKQDTLLGRVTAAFKVKGQSFDINTMVADVEGTIQSAWFRGYNYNSISLTGSVHGKEGTLDLVSNDPNAHLQLNGTADFKEKYPSVLADLNIDSADLHALGFYKEEMEIRAKIHADVPVVNKDYPKGVITIDRPTVLYEGKNYFLDSMYVISDPSGNDQHIEMKAQVLTALVEGHTPLSKIPAIIKSHIDRHYGELARLRDTLHVKHKPDTTKIPANYDLNVSAVIEDGEALRALMPDLKRMDTVFLAGYIDPKIMQVNGSIGHFYYGNIQIDSGKINIDEADSALLYSASIKNLREGKIVLVNTLVEGQIENDIISATLTVKDDKDKKRFLIAASMKEVGKERIIHLNDSLLLNYSRWDVYPGNRIVVAKEGMYIDSLSIRHGEDRILIYSPQKVYNSPIHANIRNFNLSNISRIISTSDTLLVDGILSGNVDINHLKPNVNLNADLAVKQLAILNDTVGDVAIKAHNTDDNTINSNIVVSGLNNNITISGDYYLKAVNGNNFNLGADIASLNPHTMEGFAQHEIRNSSGNIHGHLDIRGTTDAPTITGNLQTNNFVTTVTRLGADFHIPDQKINFTDKGIHFDNFIILDSAGNKMVVNGDMLTKNYQDWTFDMTAKANNMRVLNSTPKDNKEFYGIAYITADVTLKGNIFTPDVDGDVTVLKKTKFTLVLPEDIPDEQSAKGVVRFVSKQDSARRRLYARDSTRRRKAQAGSYSVNVNLTIDTAAEFTLIIDPTTGDYLTVRGDGTINTSMSSRGVFTMAGVYEVKQGFYQLNYNFIRRRFEIRRGSNITFDGDPTHARLDIVAVYHANAAPYELIERQVTDQSQLNYYKEKLPFQVILNLRGEVMHPSITFDIDLPEGQIYRMSSEGVDMVRSRLSQLRTDTSELNKQAFSLLLLNRFVGEDPFTSSAGTTVASAATQSVSRFISNQLNKYASSLIKGVDLNLDLASSEDYTTGTAQQRTDLNVGASKRLLNERLKVTVGANIELSGPQTANTNNMIPGNISIDYMFTPDGRYSGRIYSQNIDAGALEGYVTQTGIGLIANYEYNKFKNLFNRKKRKKEREARRARELLMEQQKNGTLPDSTHARKTQPDSTNARKK